MAYDKKKLEQQALKAIKEHNLFFITDITAYLPCTRETFYAHGLHKSDTIKAAIEKNKIKTTQSMKNKWYHSDNATLQVALMKIIGTDEVRKRLTQSYQEIEHSGMVGSVNLNDNPDALKTLLKTFQTAVENINENEKS